VTDQPQPPPYDDDAHPHVVQQLTVPAPPGRVPRPGGLAIIVLAIVVAVLAGYIAVLLIDARHSRAVQRQLACEVQRLGGQGISGVDCPSSPASARPTPRPAPTPTTTTLVVVVPSAVRGPAGPAGPAGRPAPAASPRSPAPAASAGRPPSSPTTRPSPTPSCRAPNPLPTGPRCLLSRATQRS